MFGDLVSIIVPVYNVEDYIEECVKSIINQTYKNIEIILINDGSTDRTEEICRRFVNEDSRISLFSQKNQGVAVARKNGISRAKGQFIGFVDGDDWIECDYYARLVECSGEFDLITAGYKNGYGENISIFDKVEQGKYTSHSEVNYILDNMIIYENTEQHGITTFMWNKLFRTELAKEVSLETSEKIVVGEDAEFVYRYLLKCNSVLISNICGYYYRMRDNSAVHGVNKYYLSNINELYCGLEKAFLNHNSQEKLIFQLQKWVSRMISMATSHMGFRPETQCMSYIFPFINLINDKKVVLYGAGRIGQIYYLQIKKWNICTIEKWVDKNWKNYQDKGLKVSPINALEQADYDYVVIAVLAEKIASDIKEQLITMGIQEGKILWKEPISTII